MDPASDPIETMTEQETAACNQPHPSDLVTQPLSPDRQSVVMVPASPQREVSPSRSSSTPKLAAVAPLKASKPVRRFNDQLSFLDDILEDEQDVSIHKKVDKVLENQKVLFKLIADFMKRERESTCVRISVRY